MFFCFQNDEFDNYGGFSVHNMRCSIEHTDCSTKRHVSKCTTRCTTRVRGQSSFDCVKGGKQQSLVLEGD